MKVEIGIRGFVYSNQPVKQVRDLLQSLIDQLAIVEESTAGVKFPVRLRVEDGEQGFLILNMFKDGE